MLHHSLHRIYIIVALTALVILSIANSKGEDKTLFKLELHPIDRSRVGKAMPDSSAVIGSTVITAMQNSEGHPEVLLYKRNDKGEWESTVVGVVTRHKEEIEWVAAGKPFPDDSRICVAASVQHKKDGLVVFCLREPGLDPFDGDNWEQGVVKNYAGQGLAFKDLDGDDVDELIYATQGGNELGVLKAKENGDHLAKEGWTDHVIDRGNNRAWWWLNNKYYDLNNDGLENDFFVSSRSYGGSDLGMWKVVQTKPNDLSSYEVEKIYDGNSLWFDTGYLFSANHDRNPDIVMVDYKRKEVHLMDGRNGYELTSLPFNGVPWNVKVLPFTDGERDAFVVAAAKSPSLFWSFQWRGGAYEVRKETEHKGNYEHPLDGTFTIADVDGDGQKECVVPDSSKDKRAKGLSYLEAVPMTKPTEPENQFQLND